MPHKIGFVVVSSSGHEDGFSARELMIHAPTVSGWRSPRFCRFPQEIVLQTAERCRMKKLQLLAHQYMIPSKVEFYVSERLPEPFAPPQAERFRRLGYVSLCDNEKTGCRARELKSVYVDAVGQFLKLIFHQNHANKYNIYNQASREKLIDHYLGHSLEDPALEGSCSGKSDYISPLDDLAFDMYQDPEVAQIIRKLDERKREAARQERYDDAKKLRQALADLQKVRLWAAGALRPHWSVLGARGPTSERVTGWRVGVGSAIRAVVINLSLKPVGPLRHHPRCQAGEHPARRA
uniref:Centrosomal protein 104 n=1 Tax=Molossus molossus TaxID=27622 RepID=A0A7J8F6T5_MOLMO|nr:centrosomal protein 104 [Molossus molossus]